MNFARWPILGSRRPEPARKYELSVFLQIWPLGARFWCSGRPWRNETAPKKIFESTRFPGALYAALWRRLALSSRAEGLGLLLCPELGLFVPGCGPASCWPCCWLGCMPWILSGLLCGAVSEGRSGRTSCRALISEGLCRVLLIRSGLRRWCALLPAWAPELCLLFHCLPRHRWELRRRRPRRSRCCLPSRCRDNWRRQWPASS